MKKTISAIAAIAAIGSTAFGPAHAADGTINFVGKLEAQTCTINVNGVVTPSITTVVLPTVSIDRLATAGEATGQTSFNIGLKNCSSIADNGVTAFFESSKFVNGNTGNLLSTGTAHHVELQLVDGASGGVIRVGDMEQSFVTTRIAMDATGSAILPYAVQYYVPGPAATAGTVAGNVTYSIVYH